MTAPRPFRLAPEQRLLLACSRIDLGHHHRKEIHDLIERQIDWDGLLHRAARHGIANLVFHHLRGLDVESAVPVEFWQKLGRSYAAARLVAMRQRHEALRVIDAFTEAGIQVMPLKGLALRERLYPDPGMRTSDDIDLMVHEEEWQRAEGCLIAIGFHVSGEEEPRDLHVPGKFHHMAPYRSPNGGVQVEVHWHLAPLLLHVDAGKLWLRAEEEEIDGRKVALLSAEDQFLHLCVHAAQTVFSTGLRHLIDVAELDRERTICEETLVTRAVEWDVGHFVSATACLVNDLIGGSALCRSLVARNGSELSREVTDTAYADVIGIGESTGRGNPGIGLALATVMLREQRWHELFRRVFPNRRYMERAYGLEPGSKLVFPLYAARPFLLLARYGSALLRPSERRRFRLRMWLRRGKDV